MIPWRQIAVTVVGTVIATTIVEAWVRPNLHIGEDT